MHLISAVIVAAVLIGACSQCASMQPHASTAHTDVHAPTVELVRDDVVSESKRPGANSMTASVRRSHHEQYQDTPCDGGHRRLSKRVRETEPAHIEAVLSRYAGESPPPANLAQVVYNRRVVCTVEGRLMYLHNHNNSRTACVMI